MTRWSASVSRSALSRGVPHGHAQPLGDLARGGSVQDGVAQMDQGRTQTVPQEGAQPQQSHRSVGLGADPVEADAGVVVTLGHDGPGDGGDERCHRGSRGQAARGR